MQFLWFMLVLFGFCVALFAVLSKVLEDVPRNWRLVAAVLLWTLICIALAHFILFFA